jgi:hypothetical protein
MPTVLGLGRAVSGATTAGFGVAGALGRAVGGGGLAMAAAACMAFSASTVPAPAPGWAPAAADRALPVISAWRTWLLVSPGYRDRIRAAIPATMALAASVVLMFRYPDGRLAAVTPNPGAVRAT